MSLFSSSKTNQTNLTQMTDASANAGTGSVALSGGSNLTSTNFGSGSLVAGDGSRITITDGGSVAAALGANDDVSRASLGAMLGTTQNALTAGTQMNSDAISLVGKVNNASLGLASDAIASLRQAANENGNLAKDMASMAISNVAAPGSTEQTSKLKILAIAACVIAALYIFFRRK